MKWLTLFIALVLSASVLSAEGFEVESPSFKGQLPDKHVFNGFGCSGGNLSPAISWKNAPKGTKSFAVTLYDPDAPTGSGWWHWVVTDIPANIDSLKEGASSNGTLPKGAVQATTSFGQSGFGGACPPQGSPSHRYVLTVYALDVPTLNISQKATSELAGFMLGQHTLAKASLVAYYGR